MVVFVALREADTATPPTAAPQPFWNVASARPAPPPGVVDVRAVCGVCGAHVLAWQGRALTGTCGVCGSFDVRPL